MSDAPTGLSNTRQIEVSWGHCDAAGIVFYPRYYEWFDACFHAMLTAAGLGHATLRADYGAVGTPLVETRARYRAPATYDEVITAVSRIARVGRSSFTVEHRFSVGERRVVEGEEVRVWAEPAGDGVEGIRAVAIPDAVRRVLEGR